MKTSKLFLIFFFLIQLALSGKSQNIENADFDSLCVCAIDRVYHWVTSDVYSLNQDTAYPFTPNSLFTDATMELHIAFNSVLLNYDNSDSVGFAHSVKILSRPGLNYPSGDIFRGFIVNGDHFVTDNQGFIDFKRGGSAFAFRPDSISGKYKFEDSLSSVAEYGKAIVLLKKYNSINQSSDTIAYAESAFELSPSAQWKQFSIPIHYISSATPDSIVVVFFSSSNSGRPTTLCLDDLKFTYPATGIDISDDNSREIIFPNPTNRLIYVASETQKPGQYEIYDIGGALILKGTFENCIDISTLANACYILKIPQNGRPTQNFKFIKN